MRRLGWSIALTLVVVLAPTLPAYPAPGDPSNPALVTLYAHWFDVINRAPLNTIPPDETREPDLNQGFHMPTVVLRGPCGEPCNVTFQNNRFTLFTMPRELDPDSAALEYEVTDPAYDVELADGPIFFYAYLSAHPLPTQSSTSDLGELTNLGLMPSVRVSVLWETGRQYLSGVPIASGGTPDAINMVHLPGADPVYELKIPMGRFVDVVPSGMGTTLTVSVQQVATDESEVQQSSWRLRSGTKYPWRIEVPIENPIVRRELQAWTVNETLQVRWGVKAAFGSYDIDASSFRLTLGHGAEPAFALAPTRIDSPSSHTAALKTVYANWEIPFGELTASDEWWIRANVQNRQANAFLQAEEPVTLGDYDGAETPGVGLLVALGLVLAVGARVRRTR